MKEELQFPKMITRSGRLIYSEPDNPYETVEVYLSKEPHFTVKSYISEHGPDGGSSYRVLMMDDENYEKMKKALDGNVERFLGNLFDQKKGMSSLQELLDSMGIEYKTAYYM
ncbi:MAG: hypothetical protein IKX76_00075 [Eubacterium sp.]|nr:hypothetical protein [Eubacterium sp.]